VSARSLAKAAGATALAMVATRAAIGRLGLPSLRGLARDEGVTTWSAWRQGLPGAPEQYR
jgi:hypothetical protein